MTYKFTRIYKTFKLVGTLCNKIEDSSKLSPKTPAEICFQFDWLEHKN